MLTQTPPQTLTYRCPHCGTMVQVDASADGSVVNCPKPTCGKPFRVEIPVASPVISSVQPAVAPAAGPQMPKPPVAQAAPLPNQTPLPATTPGNEPEHVVRTFHLSMFRRYPWRCLGYLLIVAASLAVAVWMRMHDWEWLFLLVPAGLAVFAALRLAVWWLRMHRTTFVLTNRRAILKTGVFAQETTTIELEHLADFHVHQSLLMRWLNVGDLAIVSAHMQEQQIVIMALADPETATSILEPHLEARKKDLATAKDATVSTAS